MKESKFKIIIKYSNKKSKSTTTRNNFSNTRQESLVVQLVGTLWYFQLRHTIFKSLHSQPSNYRKKFNSKPI